MILAFIFVILLICVFLIANSFYQFWRKRGIPYIEPSFPYGNIKSVVKKEKNFGYAIYDLYKKSDQPFLGLFMLFRPMLLVRDKMLAKNILTSDFDSFHDRGVYVDLENDPLSGNIFSLPGQLWKSLRNKITPAFTSGKLKGMFPHIKFIAESLVDHLKPLADKEETIDVFEYTHRFVVDCLASVAFGQEGISTINEPHQDFMTIPEQTNRETFIQAMRNAGVFAFPGLMKFIGLKSLSRDVREFFINLVTKTIEHRETHNILRKDLMQYLIQLRNGGIEKSDNDDDWKIHANGKTAKSMTHEEIASQAFIFHVAGHDSSAATITYILHELTQNQSLMKRAKEDIKSTLEEYDGNLTYESVTAMKFIDLCVKESLRKYPILTMLNRECTKDYHVPGTDITIEKGTAIVISVLGLHRDEIFFPNPEKYNPDRFAEETHDYDEDAYMPFGIGPRNCLAYRMGLVFVKVGLVSLLMNFDFEGKGDTDLKFNNGSIALIPQHGSAVMKLTKSSITEN